MASPKLGQTKAAATPATPTQIPPAQSATSNGGAASVEVEPMPISDAELAAVLASVAGAAPALAPPEMKQTTEITAWVTSKVVNSLWSINQNRNVFAGFAGVGWKKFANNSDSAIMAFNILACNARLTQGATNYREESDGMIHEMYVW